MSQQNYEIRVRGRLGGTFRTAFPGLRARTQGNDTVLSGSLVDRAALYGVLAIIETLGLELIRLQQVTSPELVSRMVRAGELEVSGGDQAEIDTYFNQENFRFHGPGGFETDYAALTAYFESLRAAWKPLVSRSGGIPLKRQRTAVLTDQRPVMASARRNELILQLLAGRCEICEATANLEVHHVRKHADLSKPGRRDKPAWMHLMAKRRRKTLITCRRCHEDIHAGRATKPYPK